MKYIRVTWKHDNPEDPIDLYSEIDENSWEIRKVEVFSDGRMGYSDRSDHSESTRLGLAPVPGVEEIAKDPEFAPIEINRSEFERHWEAARAARVF